MEITVKGLQAYLYHQYGQRGTEQGMFMKLVEEMGEVAEILNKRAGRKSSDGSDLQMELGQELTDVIHYAVAIAAINGIDLNAVMLEKDRQASVKYHHDVNLETFLRQKEEEND